MVTATETQREKLTAKVCDILDELVELGSILLEEEDGSVTEDGISYFGGHISALTAAAQRTADAISKVE